MSDVDEVDSEFVRVSFSSRGSRSVTIERSTNGRRKSSASSDWKPAKRRFLLHKLNASIYNCLARLRLLFSPCCCRSFALNKGADLVLLGQRYTQSDSTVDLFQDIYSRLYFSYRTGFVPLKHSRLEIRSDTGWGCTIRTAQMLAAEGLVRHRLGRNYRRIQSGPSGHENLIIEGIVRLFHDEPSIHCPFSIHNMTSLAFREFGQKPGQWYNPSMVGHVLHKAVRQHQALGDQAAPQLNDLCVYVARDGCIFVEDLLELCMPKGSNVRWRSPLILVALRLGIESVRTAYQECLRRVLENRYTLGIVGGRENSSYFFIGYQNDQLLYLDPHYLRSIGDQETEHYFAKEVRRMPFKNLRPSCLLGFYCQNQDELGEFLSSVQDDVSAIEIETGETFQLVDICSGSGSCLDSKRLLSRKSLGSLEILSLFEQRGLLS